MPGLNNILNIMATSQSAESERMNITASNLANAGSMGKTEAETYHAKHAVFSTITQSIAGLSKLDQSMGGVQVTDVIPNTKPLNWRYDPNNPIADKDGHVYQTDVNPIEEMTDMIAASRQYQASSEVITTTKKLLMETIRAIEN